MFGIGGWELLLIAAVALLVLGPKKLPSAARAIGRAANELRRATTDLRQSLELDPDLKELPKALDEINRPLLSPGPYSRKRAPRDGPPQEAPHTEKEKSENPENDAVETTQTKGAHNQRSDEPPLAAASRDLMLAKSKSTEESEVKEPSSSEAKAEPQLRDRSDGESGG